MKKCSACKSIVLNYRKADGHDRLKPTALKIVKFTTGVILFAFYECADCGTKWSREDDRQDPGSGWMPV
jgi:DNA-directed RNA polymerase subunit RPC12/RpoP